MIKHRQRALGSLLVVGLLLGVAPVATAQGRGDSKPVISEVRDGNNQKVSKAPQGGVLNLIGRNLHKCKEPPEGTDPAKWHCTHDEIDVTVAGQKALIVASTFDYVTFIIPQAVRPDKKVRIEVSIERRGSDSTSIEVVGVKEWQASATERTSEAGGAGAVRQDEESRILDTFKITRFAQVPTSAGNTFVLEGIAKGVPDRMTLQVELRYDGRTIPNGTRIIEIEKEAFKTTFGPYSKQLLYGNYSLELFFELGKQTKRLRREWDKVLSDTAREVYGRIQRREFTQVGTGPNGTVTPDDREKQQAKLKAHYLEFCTEVVKLRDALRAAVADAGRSFFRDGRDYDQERYKAWLKQMGFADTDAKAQEILDKATYAKSTGHFQAKVYLDWAKGTLIPGLKGLYDKHRGFNDQYICPMDENADTMGDWLISIVLMRLQEWSKQLYDHSGLPLPDEIGQVPLSPIKAPELSRKFFDAKRRELMRRVGLDSYLEKETP